MSDETTQNAQQRDASTGSGGWFAESFKKNVSSILTTVLLAFIVSYWNSEKSQDSLSYDVRSNKEANVQNAATMKQFAEKLNDVVISLTKIVEQQNRLATDIKEMQERERQRAERALLNQK